MESKRQAPLSLSFLIFQGKVLKRPCRPDLRGSRELNERESVHCKVRWRGLFLLVCALHATRGFPHTHSLPQPHKVSCVPPCTCTHTHFTPSSTPTVSHSDVPTEAHMCACTLGAHMQSLSCLLSMVKATSAVSPLGTFPGWHDDATH